MGMFGLIGLLIAFAGVAVSIVCLLVGHFLARKTESSAGETLTWGGHIAAVLSAVALTLCCGILVFCFMTGDTTIQYVVQNHSNASGDLGWLYKLSGLWGGRQGSLLFWAWLIAVFNAIVAIRNMGRLDKLDNMALLVSQIVLAAFVGVMLFSETNMPFVAMASTYFDSAGNLTNGAQIWGMNALLEHWAMAIHPPTLFIGYAGLTIPFAYGIAALIVNDSSKAWIERCARFTIFSWLLLGIGIGLGAVWAYVVLGWGGYWGWDAVENASLLSWLVGVALIHSFTVYRQRGAFKRWAIMCACITFAFVIVGTFITRSGIVQSVHAFEGDIVSLILFLGLILSSVLAGIVGLIIRWKSFGPAKGGQDDIESMLSKDAAYYFNNVIMLVFALLLCYLTVSSALPSWMPFGGDAVSVGTYNTIARPLGIMYCMIIAVCPLLSWGRTEGRDFWKRARIPGILALIMFAGLMMYFVTTLLPGYETAAAAQAALMAEGKPSSGVLDYGPSLYYNGLAVVGFLVASLLFFNSLLLIGRGICAYKKSHKTNVFAAAFGMVKNHAATYGGFISHFAMSIILVGLIGSSMYVTEKVAYIGYDEATDTASEDLIVRDYRLAYTGSDVQTLENGTDILYTVRFDVFKGEELIGHVEPAVQVVPATQQQKLLASVISFPSEDLFVVYKGVNEEGAFAMDVRVNPLISLVWVGFGLLMVGITIALVGKRGASSAAKKRKFEKLGTTDDAALLDDKAEAVEATETDVDSLDDAKTEAESSEVADTNVAPKATGKEA